jgi:hypothetical protein
MQRSLHEPKLLRSSIRGFAEDFGEIDARDHPNPKFSYSLFKKYLCVSEDALATYIESPSARPKILRPLLWAFLFKEVFDQFFWAPPDIRSALRTLRGLIGISYPKRELAYDPIANNLPRAVAGGFVERRNRSRPKANNVEG